MARTDYGAILSTVISGTSEAIRHSEGTSSLIAPSSWAREINKLKVMPTKKIKGSICSFSDGADNSPIISLSASVSGSGCNVVKTGKNLLHLSSSPITVQGVTFKETENGITITGSPSSSTFTTIFEGELPLGNCTICDFVTGSNSTHQMVLRKNGTTIAYITADPYTFSVTSKEDVYSVRLYVYSGNTHNLIKPQLEVGSTASSYEAYKSVTYPITFPSTVTSGSITINADGTVDLTSGGTTTRLDSTVDIRTYYGANNIWVDTGDISNLDYYADSELLYLGQMIEETISSTPIASFTDGADNIPLKSLTVDVNPVQSGTGDPSPSNIRPITGHDTAVITRTGKNLFEVKPFSDWTSVGSYKALKKCLPANQSMVMSFSDKDTTIDISDVYFGFLTSSWSGGGGTAPSTSDYRWCLSAGVISSNTSNRSVSGGNLLDSVFIYPNTETAYNKLFARYNIQIELGSSATAYEPYTGSTTTTDFGTTVYGGTLDVTTGVLTKKYEKYKLGSSGWVESSGRYQHRYEGIMKSGSYYSDKGAICDTYPKLETLASGTGLVFGYNSDYLYFYVKDDFPTLADWTTYLENNDVYVTMPLATPTTIQLTPQEVKSLLGSNNIYHDCNGQVAMTYKANGQLYVEQHT